MKKLPLLEDARTSQENKMHPNDDLLQNVPTGTHMTPIKTPSGLQNPPRWALLGPKRGSSLGHMVLQGGFWRGGVPPP